MDWRQIENDKEKYAAYLCSREWAEKREAVRERAYGKCERCFIAPMDACHHLTYERKYGELLEDLQAICNDCHEFTHGKSDEDNTSGARLFEIDSLGFVTCPRCDGPWCRIISSSTRNTGEVISIEFGVACKCGILFDVFADGELGSTSFAIKNIRTE